MSTWRIETANNSEKNSEQVIEKMAAAARALGWPEQIVDAIRAQLQSITEMQIQMMDQMMDAWEEQIKSPNPMTSSPSAMLSNLKSSPGVSPSGNWPNANAWQTAMNPMQFWIQLAEQWQKAWADAMSFWAKAGKPNDGVELRRLDKSSGATIDSASCGGRCQRSVRDHPSDPVTALVRAAPPETCRSLKPAPTSARS
jgi:hypothetical protein